MGFVNEVKGILNAISEMEGLKGSITYEQDVVKRLCLLHQLRGALSVAKYFVSREYQLETEHFVLSMLEEIEKSTRHYVSRETFDKLN